MEASMDQALSPAEVQHFLTFGYVHRRGCFSATEMDALTAHADARLATSEVSNHDGRAQSGPAPAAVLESNNLDEVAFIGPVLADRRVHGAVKQLMEALGASRFLFGGDSHLSAGPIKSEGWTGFATLPADAGADTPHAGAALDKDWYEHGWHSDIPGPSETGFARIKTMLYLTKTTKDQGAIRFIPGSHFESFQQHLKPLQGWHGVHNTHPTWAEHTFGVFGPDVPSVAIESEPGDFVLFHHSLYHAVYNHSPDRRLVQGSWVAYPDTPEFKASCFRSGGGIFTARPALAAHSDADIRQLTLSEAEAAALKEECEAAHLGTPFPDSDINVYPPANEHRESAGTLQWRAAANGGQDPMAAMPTEEEEEEEGEAAGAAKL